MLNLLHFNFFINFVCLTSRLIDVVCMCVSNKVVKRKTSECLIFLPFRKMLSKKKHISDNFLLKFQDEDKRFVNIYHFGIEPTDFQTSLTLELLSQLSIQTATKANTLMRMWQMNRSTSCLKHVAVRRNKTTYK